MQFKKSFLALAVAVALTPLSTLAALNLETSTGGAIYATQIKLNPTATVSATGTELQATGTLGVGTPANQTLYFRFDLSNGATFAGPPVFVGPPDSGTVGGSVSSVTLVSGGAGSNFVVFSAQPSDATETLPIDGAFSITASTSLTEGITVINRNPVTLQYRLYAILGSALNPTVAPPVDTLETKTGTYVSFKTGVTLTTVPYTNTADVEATPSFTAFLLPASTPPFATLTNANLGDVTLTADTTVLLKKGTAVAALNDLVAVGSTLAVAGDFSARAAGVAGVRRGAAANSACAGNTADATPTDTAASFTLAGGDVTGASLASAICYIVNGTSVIPESAPNDYTIALQGVAVSAEYDPVVISATNLGNIIRNGTELQASLAQTPAGWTSRIALTNTGTLPRVYTTRFLPEGTDTFALATAAEGSVPAGGTVIVNVADVVTITASDGSARKRGTIVMNVAGPTSSIQGIYQLISPAGAVTNAQMVRPGTN
jgi:hypothetical protein